MDRSFLSRLEVIAASRAFVCIRLATYEDPLEAKLLKGIARTASGELENTAFCLLAPDGKTKLIHGARGIEQVYADAQEMAEGMDRVTARYSAKASPSALPVVANVRLAIDIAAADNRPLVVIVGGERVRDRLTKQVASLAWSDAFIGRFVYASGSNKELAQIGGVKIDSGIAIVAPDKFGQKGAVLQQTGTGSSETDIAEA